MIRKVSGRAPRPARGRARYPSRRARERRRRVTEVLEAARRLFVRHGFAGTTIADIAASSEFSIGTLYELFPSKEAILRRLLEERIDRLLARLREAAEADAGADARARITSIVRTHLGFFREDPELLRLSLSAWSGSDFTVRRDLGERIDRRHREYLRLLVPVFEHGIRAGVLVRRPAMRMAVALTGLINALIRRWVREPDLDLVAEGEATLEMFFEGISRR